MSRGKKTRLGSIGPQAQFVALNGGPQFKFSEAISFQIHCDTQAEIDRFWGRLTEGGSESQCGWLKDRFGLSWQVVPSVLPKLLTDPDRAKAQRVTNAFMQMKKFDIAALQPIGRLAGNGYCRVAPAMFDLARPASQIRPK